MFLQTGEYYSEDHNDNTMRSSGEIRGLEEISDSSLTLGQVLLSGMVGRIINIIKLFYFSWKYFWFVF